MASRAASPAAVLATDDAASPAAVLATRREVAAGMRILVRFRADATEAERADAVRSVNGWIDAELPAIGITRIALPGDASGAFGVGPAGSMAGPAGSMAGPPGRIDGPAVAETLARHPAIELAELDRTVSLAFDPNDALYRDDPYVDLGQWGIKKALVDKAWDRVRGSADVVVAVLDTGADTGHPDLAGALVTGKAFVTNPASECDEGATKDDSSHGTHVAGIVGALANNRIGVAGAAFGVRVMPVKVLDCLGDGSLSDVANGIVWAVDRGARIVNLSLGSPFESRTLREAVSYATTKDVLVVSAVGNCGTLGGRCTSLHQVEYPAAYPEVIAVGATDTDDEVTFFSSQNATVDVVAPGRRIVSTTPTYATTLSRRATDPATRTYGAFSGTSQASPLVAAIAALVWSAEPTLTAEQVAERITTTADDLGPKGRDDAYGHGRVNALRAVTTTADRYGAEYDTSALPRAARSGQAFSARVTVTNRSSFTWRASGTGAVKLGWSWLEPSGTRLAAPAGTIALPADLAAGAAVELAGSITAPATPQTYTLRLDLARGDVAFSAQDVKPASVAVVVGSGLGASYAPVASAATFDVGATTSMSVVLTNTGTTAWIATGATPVRLSYHWLKDGSVLVWDGLRAALPSDVAPGGKVSVALPVMPPAQPGSYTLRLDLVQEGVAWFSGQNVVAQDLPATVRSAYAATYSTGAPAVLLPGGRTLLPVTVKNTGTAAWAAAGSAPVRLAAHVLDARGNVAIWDGARTAFAADVAPGAQVAASVTIDAPLAPGSYRVKVDLVREGIAWFSSIGVAAGEVDLLVAADYRARFTVGPLTVSATDPVVDVAATNTGIATWTTGGAAPIALAAHWYDAAGNVLVWDGPRTALAAPVAPGATVTVAVRLGPPPAGAAAVTIDLVSEGVRWFGAGTLRAVTLAP